MKSTYIKRIVLSVTLACSLAISSCERDFGDINDPWDNRVYSAKIPELYNGIAASMPENGRGIFSSFLYQRTQLAANYAASGFRLDNQVGGIWENYYFALADFRKAIELIEAAPDGQSYTNVRAMLTILIAFKTLKATTQYGDIPYSEAGKSFLGPEYYRPRYDSQESIFISALNDLKMAAENLSDDASQVSLGAYETLLQDDIQLWRKFANSLRLRYALVMREKNTAAADAIISEVLNQPVLEADEYLGIDPTRLSMEIDRGASFRGNSYVRLGSTMWDAMSSNNSMDGTGIFDLRAKIFFEPNSEGNWKPFPQNPSASTTAETDNGVAGNDPYAEARLTTWEATGEYRYSPLNVYYVNDRKLPDLFITGSEVSFLKAEIYNRGIGGVTANSATAQQFYEDGIISSVKMWYKLANASAVWVVNKPAAAPTPAELNVMMSNPAIAYNTNPADALKQIYKQHWIALFHQPFDAWTLQRRTAEATPNVPLAPTSEALNLNRLVYPIAENTSNHDNWLSATGGTDDRTKKPWFMP
ncbi:SusD/RagB family nutrient-binding outer membrane lipoprotein [Parapedobacter defluvii]|uniref:SusD/RagB family nutrient-binding outer membrane lipoprotein n=1 Tax=Parapedobacter defluvii TaxID=2045106 RepID=UPI000F9F5431|nr:MAG: SusD/RagB family nutrient-binding outer membrane lipoprotein [Parapedobacter sp.]